MYKIVECQVITKKLKEQRKFIQVVMGARQIGKSTVVKQVLNSIIDDDDRFSQYIQSAIIDATINKDILMDTPISKPALLRQTFELDATYSGELLSLNKMLGSLQDVRNTVTLAGYINLLDESGLLCGLQKFSIDTARRHAPRPVSYTRHEVPEQVPSNF